MNRLVFTLAASLALASCATMQADGPGTATSVTIARATGTADAAYIAAYTIGADRVRAGTLSRADFLKWEMVAYSAVLLVRSAQTIAELTAAQQQLATATAKLKD